MLLASPFDRLRAALGDAQAGMPAIDLSIGSPKHAPPAFVAEAIARHANSWGGYPPIAGTASFSRAVDEWLERRYCLGGLLHDDGGVLPLSGSREGLVLAAIVARDVASKTNPAVLFANPYYAAYPAAALAIGAEPVPLAAAAGVLPDFAAVPEATLDRAVAYYVCSPSNPAGAVAGAADWHALFDRAERHDFILFADECYSEIYRTSGAPPTGALEAARERPGALDRLVVFNSLSKRSGLAGLRVGFAATGRRLLEPMRALRNQIGPQVPVPLMEAAALAWGDEAHVAENRRLYDAAFAAAEAALGPLFGRVTPPAGFFLWLPVESDVAAAQRLWREAGVRSLPGRFLALGGAGSNPGAKRLRLALVEDAATTRIACERIAAVLGQTSVAALVG